MGRYCDALESQLKTFQCWICYGHFWCNIILSTYALLPSGISLVYSVSPKTKLNMNLTSITQNFNAKSILVQWNFINAWWNGSWQNGSWLNDKLPKWHCTTRLYSDKELNIWSEGRSCSFFYTLNAIRYLVRGTLAKGEGSVQLTSSFR